MKKLESSLTNMLLVLTLVSAVAAFLLAYVNGMTQETVEKEKAKKEAQATRSVLNIAEDQAIVVKKDTIIKIDEKDYFITFIDGTDSCFIGATVKVTENGFGGEFEVLVGFDAEGKILGYNVLKHAETPGLGARADEWFCDTTSNEVEEVSAISKVFFGNPSPAGNHNIIGRDIAQGALKVTKDGGDIDAITASTITSRAFLNAVNNAYKAMNKVDNADDANMNKDCSSDANTGATMQHNQ